MPQTILRRTGFALCLLAAVAVTGYVGVLGVLYFTQERLIFHSKLLPANYRFAFDHDQRFEELHVPVPGASLDALLFEQANPRGLMFFIHGNTGSLANWAAGLDFYRKINFDLFMFDFRGFGKSTGRISSEDQLVSDVRAAWDSIAPRFRGKPIVIYGRSLGTGLAARLAREVAPRLLVLVTPYTSLAEIGQREYPLIPEFLNRYPLHTDRIIGDIKCPILLIHGTDDTLIPLDDSERLQKLAHSPTELLVVNGAGHYDIHNFPAYLDGLAKRLIAVGRG